MNIHKFEIDRMILTNILIFRIRADVMNEFALNVENSL